MFFNDLAIYRKAIYKMMDDKFDCDWYIEEVDTKVKEFDSSELRNVKRLPIRTIGPFYVVKGLCSLLHKDYDIYFVLGATRNLSLFVFCLIKRLFFPQKRIYFWTHGYYGKECFLEHFFWKRPLFKLSDGIFVYSDYSKKLMERKGFDPLKIFPIHNSLSYEEQRLLRDTMTPSNIYRDHFNNLNPVLIMIGRLNYRKHLDMLFNAVAILNEKGTFYNIVLIGDGEDKHKLEQLAISLGLSNQTWFYGACYDERENAKLVYNADLCVVPGDVGLTAIHSLMFGVPVITHNKFMFQGPEFETIKEGKTGAFYEYGSVDNLATTINEWFKEKRICRDAVRQACYDEIDTGWNPYYQMEIISKHLV